ncbi:MAG: 3-hydroxyacyl-ACP dehydratase FabZ [Hydrogenophilus sp.]|nr:3-hydroxyacyl-ACP dehydratase FabZ [Hydrogenophilus sp.]
MGEIREIMSFLPHRYPFLLVDRVIEVELGKRIVAIKNVTVNEPFFQGHFPGQPIFPGVLILEALAQAAAILSFQTMGRLPGEASTVYYAGIDKARFKRPVVPGDQLRLEVTILRTMRHIWRYAASAYVERDLAAAAEIMCALKE